MTESVELIPAYEWTCDACGQRNYASTIVKTLQELSAEEAAEVCEAFGKEPYELNDGMAFQFLPDVVECGHCSAEYVATEWIGSGGDDNSNPT